MAEHKNFEPILGSLDVVISNGATTTAEIDLRGTTLLGVFIPSAITGTSITFQASYSSGGTFQTVYKNGSDLIINIAANKFIVLNPADFVGIQFLKIVSSATEVAARTLTLSVRPV